MTETPPLPSREGVAIDLALAEVDLSDAPLRDILTIAAEWVSGRLVDREAIDRERIEEILNELCRDWGESLEGAGYDFGRAIDAIVAAIGEA